MKQQGHSEAKRLRGGEAEERRRRSRKVGLRHRPIGCARKSRPRGAVSLGAAVEGALREGPCPSKSRKGRCERPWSKESREALTMRGPSAPDEGQVPSALFEVEPMAS